MIAQLLVIHFVADFLLQTREMGKKKSVEFKWLAGHLAIQFSVFFVVLSYLADPAVALWFAVANAAVHGVIDWNIWKLYKLSVVKRFSALNWKDPQQTNSYDYWNDSWFYHTIGLDQLLHGLTLIFLAKEFL